MMSVDISGSSSLPLLTAVTVAGITGTVRGLRTEVPVGPAHGLDRDSALNCNHLATLPKARFGRYRGRLGPAELARLDDALRVALGLA
ncbi:MAG TPA: type II toxin-antitoxin system PemK/MazF family toxin [Actinomycetes bacterium]|nr:type II toxin-antitoxin system PemK/MazF family toxin [Actinomycetes bacterium]